MEKTYHLLSGLPRSGSTLLAALLNQHPELYVSPQTEVLEMIFQMQNLAYDSQPYNANVRRNGYHNVVNKIAENFYSDVQKPVILDKNRGWGTPYNMNNVVPAIAENPKIVATVRPILEVLASFTVLCNKNPGNSIDRTISDSEFWPAHYREYEDARCDYMMRPNGEIDQTILSIGNLKENHSEKTLFVWYESLTSNPQEELNKIYDFLEVDTFTNNLENINEVDKYEDKKAYGIEDLHTIGNKISKSKINYEEVLSQYVINKYKNALDFFL